MNEWTSIVRHLEADARREQRHRLRSALATVFALIAFWTLLFVQAFEGWPL